MCSSLCKLVKEVTWRRRPHICRFQDPWHGDEHVCNSDRLWKDLKLYGMFIKNTPIFHAVAVVWSNVTWTRALFRMLLCFIFVTTWLWAVTLLQCFDTVGWWQKGIRRLRTMSSMTFDNQSNGCWIEVESNTNRSCNHRINECSTSQKVYRPRLKQLMYYNVTLLKWRCWFNVCMHLRVLLSQ